MSALDEIKEKIAYRKFWLGIFVVTIISLVGWLASSYKTSGQILVAFDVVGIAILVIMAGFIDRTIRRLVQELREL